MARHKDRRRVGKDQLALAVRKDFNAATVMESEVITSFLYAIHNQGSTLLFLMPDLSFSYTCLQRRILGCDSSLQNQDEAITGSHRSMYGVLRED